MGEFFAKCPQKDCVVALEDVLALHACGNQKRSHGVVAGCHKYREVLSWGRRSRAKVHGQMFDSEQDSTVEQFQGFRAVPVQVWQLL